MMPKKLNTATDGNKGPPSPKYRTLEDFVHGMDFNTCTGNFANLSKQIENVDAPLSKSQMENTIRGLGKQLSSTEFPDDISNVYYLVHHAMRQVESIISAIEDNKSLVAEPYTKKDLVPVLADVFYTCIQHGLSTGHIKVADYLRNSLGLTDNYFKVIGPEEAKRLAASLQINYNPNKADQNNLAKHKTMYTNFFRHIFNQSMSSEPADLSALSPVYAGIVLNNLKLAASTTDEITANIAGEIAGDIFNKCRDGRQASVLLYVNKECASLLPEHIKEIKAIMADEKFPNFPKTKEKFSRWLKALLQPFGKKESFAAEHAQLYMDLLYAVLPKDIDMSDNIVRSFKDAGPDIAEKAVGNVLELIQILENIKPAEDRHKSDPYDGVQKTVQYTFPLMFKNEKNLSDCFAVFNAMVKTGNDENIEEVHRVLKGAKIKWKKYSTELTSLLSACFDLALAKCDCNNHKITNLDDLSSFIMENAEKKKTLSAMNNELIKASVACLKSSTTARLLHVTVDNACTLADWKTDIPAALEGFNVICKVLPTKLFDEKEVCYINKLHQFFTGVPNHVRDAGRIGDFIDIYVDLANAIFTMEEHGEEEEDDFTTNTAHTLMNAFIVCAVSVVQHADNEKQVAKFVPVIFRFLKPNREEVSSHYVMIFQLIVRNFPGALVDFISELTELACHYEDEHIKRSFVAELVMMYPVGSDRIHDNIQTFLDNMDKAVPEWQMIVLQLLNKIAEQNPKVYTSEQISELVTLSVSDDMSTHIFRLIDTTGEARPQCMVTILDQLIDKAYKGSIHCQVYIIKLLGNIGKMLQTSSEEMCQRLLDLFPRTDTAHQIFLLCLIKDIGIVYPEALAGKKDMIRKIKEQTPLATEHCDLMIDIMEGRSLAVLSDEIGTQKMDLENVKNDMTETNENVSTLTTSVGRQEHDINHIKEDVTKVEERLDEVEETVDDTVDKVNEIDHKTMTNAPAWSRDVSLILNPTSDHDWRLLAQRLGYSTKDVRGWATQNDPCMAVLSEWYATHKTSEATHGVLKALEEIERLDAVNIIKKALGDAETAVPEDVEDTGPLPPVFLSYQWGHQPHAKLLKQHLESAGYRCWMDLGQMGGGDKLFSKIDAGMRAATVIICCVSEKYAKSDNCNREVTLATSLGKTVIPLLMEKMSWPPAGSMGPIFGEYLFIRFFQRSAEVTGDSRYWPAAKFDELLMQLSYNVIPDETMVTGEYAGWWQPKTDPEEIVIPATKESTPAKVSSDKQEITSDAPKDPEVFISYQWGKQPQIKSLHSRLVSLGYTCWLDIYQMGGGDSLYDKIDRGIRNAKVIVTCVTPKYALSANCRREVSLADALKKPIVPLLLDPMTWPPEGSMSMVFTQLVYIGFHKDQDVQMKWTGAKFDEVIQQLELYAPRRGIQCSLGAVSNEVTDKPSVESSKPVEESKPKSEILTKNQPEDSKGSKPGEQKLGRQKEDKPKQDEPKQVESKQDKGKPPPTQEKSTKPEKLQTQIETKKPEAPVAQSRPEVIRPTSAQVPIQRPNEIKKEKNESAAKHIYSPDLFTMSRSKSCIIL